MERFVNKNVFLTGAASGIGKATARRLANEGAKLIIADVNQKQLDKTCNAVSYTHLTLPTS